MAFFDLPVGKEKAALWFLGQSGFYFKCAKATVVIDPYLSDSVGEATPPFSRAYPVPVAPQEIQADIFIVTHDHLDHLDPQTIRAYAYKEQTQFVSPRHSAEKLVSLGVPQKNVTVVDHGDQTVINGVKIQGIFALGTGADVVDTTGYKLTFENGKSVYHTSDTAFCQLLLDAAPSADVLLPVINGKFGNLGAEQAAALTKRVNPKFVIPHHYDVMALNSENPQAFRYFCEETGFRDRGVILKPLEKVEW